jgi:argonaute-like protein implicated in RNA metabolism and viral defense
MADINGNVEVTVKQRLETIQEILDVMQNLNGRKGRSKYGFVNTSGRRQLKRIGQFLNELGEDYE